MKCFGDSSKTFHVKVVLLDEQELIQEVQETTSGQDLLDIVFQHLNLLETSYFGLRYIDPSNQTHWLDPTKRLSKQLKGASPCTLYFSVKFYAADPTKLVEEITRYQFFLQVKQDVLQGRLPVTPELMAELGSYAVQSELGDYDPRRHSPGYVSEFRFVTSQVIDLEGKIAEQHKKLVSYVPSKAEMCYLEKVKWLDMYGVDLHPVLGEDSTEYFLGLTPSGIIVLRNKAKVGNYFWPRITKVYFRGKFFMLRVKDKNNIENTYGFETPCKSACKHLWQCCVEHHAFFRLTQAAGNNPQAIFSIGSKFRYSGRTEKEALSDAKQNARPQTEFTRTPSRRYQRRIVEGAQDTPRVEEPEIKPETRTIVSLPGTVTPVSHVYRSTSMMLTPRSDSPRSTKSAPHPLGLKRMPNQSNTEKRESRHSARGQSPSRSVKSASAGRALDSTDRINRRTSSVESQSSADSRSCHRSCSRHRRSRCRSSDGESDVSSKCSSSSKGHRRRHHRHHHRRHRHHSDDSSDHHKHRHRRRSRRRSSEREEPQMIESGNQWARVQSGVAPSKSNTATVRDLTSGYMPSGHDDTEPDAVVHHHSSRRKHKKQRSRSRSPSEQKHKNFPDEIRRHIEYNLKNTSGLTEAQLKEIPYTKVETAKNVKIKYGLSPNGKRHKSPKRSKSNSSDRKNNSLLESPYPEKSPYTNEIMLPNDHSNNSIERRNNNSKENDVAIVNGSHRPYPRSNQVVRVPNTPTDLIPLEGPETSPPSSLLRDCSPPKNYHGDGIHQRTQKEGQQLTSPLSYGPNANNPKNCLFNGDNTYSYNNQTLPTPDQHPFNNTFETGSYTKNCSTTQHQPSHINHPTEGAFQQHPRDSKLGHQETEEEEMSSGFIDHNNGGSRSQSPTVIKTIERGSIFTSVLKPQSSPQSSVTSGISVGSSSASATMNDAVEEGRKPPFEDSLTNVYRHFVSGDKKKCAARNNVASPSSDAPNDQQPTLKLSEKIKPPTIIINGGDPRKQKLNNLHNQFVHHSDRSKVNSRNNNWDSVPFQDNGYHTLEKRPNKQRDVNLRNHLNLTEKRVIKYRPNSFSYDQKPIVNEPHVNNNEYKSSNLQNDNPKSFKPILKSFSSEDNLSSSLMDYDRSVTSENFVAIPRYPNQNNRVRWNLEENSKNLMNVKSDPSSKVNCGVSHIYNNSLTKTNPIFNVNNDLIYAGKTEMIEIKNNRMTNLKTLPVQPPPPTSFSAKKKCFRDEISTEL